MEYKTIKIDMAFPDSKSNELIYLLSNGWRINDKSIMKERYIFYILSKTQNCQPNGDTALPTQKEK